MSDAIALTSTVVRSRTPLSGNLADGLALLDIEEGTYYHLNDSATRIWDLLQTPIQVSALVETLLKEFDVERRQCETQALALLRQLHAHRLIESV